MGGIDGNENHLPSPSLAAAPRAADKEFHDGPQQQQQKMILTIMSDAIELIREIIIPFHQHQLPRYKTRFTIIIVFKHLLNKQMFLIDVHTK